MVMFKINIATWIHKITGSEDLVIRPEAVEDRIYICIQKACIQHRNDFSLAPVSHIVENISLQDVDLGI